MDEYQASSWASSVDCCLPLAACRKLGGLADLLIGAAPVGTSRMLVEGMRPRCLMPLVAAMNNTVQN
jgi:hypothetical protein